MESKIKILRYKGNNLIASFQYKEKFLRFFHKKTTEIYMYLNNNTIWRIRHPLERLTLKGCNE